MSAARFNWSNCLAVPPCFVILWCVFQRGCKAGECCLQIHQTQWKEKWTSLNPNSHHSVIDVSGQEISSHLSQFLRTCLEENHGALETENEMWPGQFKVQHTCRRGDTHATMEGEGGRWMFRLEWYNCREEREDKEEKDESYICKAIGGAEMSRGNVKNRKKKKHLDLAQKYQFINGRKGSNIWRPNVLP